VGFNNNNLYYKSKGSRYYFLFIAIQKLEIEDPSVQNEDNGDNDDKYLFHVQVHELILYFKFPAYQLVGILEQ
jgi:hypothetical protein